MNCVNIRMHGAMIKKKKSVRYFIRIESCVNMFLFYKSQLSIHHIIRNSHLHYYNQVTVLHVIGLVLFTLRHLCLYQYEECILIPCLHFTAKNCVNAPDTTLKENASHCVQTENQLSISTKLLFIQSDTEICDYSLSN